MQKFGKTTAKLSADLQQTFGEKIQQIAFGDMVTADIGPENLISPCVKLLKAAPFQFEQLMIYVV